MYGYTGMKNNIIGNVRTQYVLACTHVRCSKLPRIVYFNIHVLYTVILCACVYTCHKPAMCV